MGAIGNQTIAKIKICVMHLIKKNRTILDGETCFHSNTILPSGVTITINGTGEFLILSTGG